MDVKPSQLILGEVVRTGKFAYVMVEGAYAAEEPFGTDGASGRLYPGCWRTR